MTENKSFLTKEGVQKLQNRIGELKKELAEISKGKMEAAELGGNLWHDNPAFEEIENKQRMLIAQIEEIKKQLMNAAIIEKDRNRDDAVARIGSTVQVKFENGETLTAKISDHSETDPSKGIISYQSPLGKAILGAREGENKKYNVGDRVFKIVINKIHNNL